MPWLDDRWVALSPTEAAAMQVLLPRLGRAVARQQLASRLWPAQPAGATRVTQLIRRLRTRIQPLGLEIGTIRGHGYRLDRLR